MPDIGPLGPEYHQMQRIAYPDVPSDCVSKLNDLITAITIASNHLNGSAGQVQTFMYQTNGIVQNVTTISQGKAAQALAKTWNASMTDGKQSHTGMTDASSHLSSTIASLNEHLQTVSAGMQVLEAVKSNAGQVLASDVQEIESQLSGLTNAFNNIGMVLNGAATLINTLNSNWPQSCATGLVPGTVYPTFVPHAFDNSIMHMNGGSGYGGNSALAEPPVDDAPKLPYQLNPEPAQNVVARYPAIMHALMYTQRGQEALRIQYRYNVSVDQGVPGGGSYYTAATNTVTIDPSLPQDKVASVFVHEMSHAEYANTGRTVNVAVNVMTSSRADYINGMLTEEADGQVKGIQQNIQSGNPVSVAMQTQYAQGYQDAVNALYQQNPHATPVQFDQAGQAGGWKAVYDAFANSKTTNTKQTYKDYYGSYWDKVHKIGAN